MLIFLEFAFFGIFYHGGTVRSRDLQIILSWDSTWLFKRQEEIIGKNDLFMEPIFEIGLQAVWYMADLFYIGQKKI